LHFSKCFSSRQLCTLLHCTVIYSGAGLICVIYLSDQRDKCVTFCVIEKENKKETFLLTSHSYKDAKGCHKSAKPLSGFHICFRSHMIFLLLWLWFFNVVVRQQIWGA